MIKTAQDAYLAGRQAAMVKLAEPPAAPAAAPAAPAAAADTGYLAGLANQIGLGSQGLYNGATGSSFAHKYLDPRRLATMENLSRLGMLGGAAGGTYLGGMDPRAAAISSAGALGGAAVGGNLGVGLDLALQAAGVDPSAIPTEALVSGGGALGGLGGGLAAGKYLS